MRHGSQQVEALGARLECVKEKVEGFEQMEGEWRDRVSRRLRMLWGCVGTILCLFVALVVVRHWPGVGNELLPPVARFGNMTAEGLVGGNGTLPALGSGILGKGETGDGKKGLLGG